MTKQRKSDAATEESESARESPWHAADTVVDTLEKSREIVKRLPAIGYVAWLCSQSQSHRQLFVQDLEWRMFPPIILGQYKLRVDEKVGGLPTAFASWAFLSQEAENNYRAVQKLRPGDWRTGDRLWLVDFVAPFGGAAPLLEEVYEVHRERDLKVLYPNSHGAPAEITLWELLRRRSGHDTDASAGADDVHHH